MPRQIGSLEYGFCPCCGTAALRPAAVEVLVALAAHPDGRASAPELARVSTVTDRECRRMMRSYPSIFVPAGFVTTGSGRKSKLWGLTLLGRQIAGRVREMSAEAAE